MPSTRAPGASHPLAHKFAAACFALALAAADCNAQAADESAELNCGTRLTALNETQHTDPSSVEFLIPPREQLSELEWRGRLESARDTVRERPIVMQFDGAGACFLNALIRETSPYLLQHAFQPVAWRPWSPPTKTHPARLRLISIGYSTCHWCHEMARGAFSDPESAALLNQHVIAMKVDREELPDVDQTYGRWQQAILGTRGWPITVVETSDGRPVYVGAYLSSADFKRLVRRLIEADKSPAQIDALSNSLQQLAPPRTTTAASNADSVSDSALSAAAKGRSFEASLRPHWDDEYGGMKGAQKFPNAPMLEWLIDELIRSNSEDLKRALTTQLDAMLVGGLWDPLEGGFFRYSTQSDWSHPHFEKMLSTQADMIAVYARAGAALDRPEYLAVARATLDFVDRWLWDADAGLANSAVDAQFLGEEGRYYWLTEADRTRLADDPTISEYQANGHWLARLNAGHWTARRGDLALRLRRIDGESNPRPFVDDKQIIEWNAKLGLALLELANAEESVTHERGLAQTLIERSAEILERLAQRRTPSGNLARDQFGAIDAHLADTAGLWRLTLALERSPSLRKLGLETPAGDALDLASTASQGLEDQEGENPIAQACIAWQQAIEYTSSESSRAMRQRCGGLALQGVDRSDHWTWFRWLANETMGATYRAKRIADGQGLLSVHRSERGRGWAISIALQPGWHVNTNRPQPRLKSTTVSVSTPQGVRGSPVDIQYPSGHPERVASIHEQPITVWSGQTSIDVRAPRLSKITIELQACSDTLCLLPQSHTLVAH